MDSGKLFLRTEVLEMKDKPRRWYAMCAVRFKWMHIKFEPSDNGYLCNQVTGRLILPLAVCQFLGTSFMESLF